MCRHNLQHLLIFSGQLPAVINFAIDVTAAEPGSAAALAWDNLHQRVAEAKKQAQKLSGVPSHQEKRQLVRFPNIPVNNAHTA